MSELYDILTETPPTKVVLLALDVLDKAGFASAAALAAKAENAAAAALLADAEHKKYAPQPKKQRYDFDF